MSKKDQSEFLLISKFGGDILAGFNSKKDALEFSQEFCELARAQFKIVENEKNVEFIELNVSLNIFQLALEKFYTV